MTDWEILIAAYILGSIPFGLLLTRMAGLGDIRNIGSGNIGATNVLRTGKKALAAITLILDMLKGTIAVLLALTFQHPFDLQLAPLAGLIALLGHMFPVWLGFKGGKGVAVALGIWLALVPFIFLLMITAWLIGAYATKRSSMGAMCCILILPAAAGAFQPEMLPIALATMGLVGLQHRRNISQVIAGTEPGLVSDMYRSLGVQEKTDWLQLIRSENVGPITFKRLLQVYGTPAAALQALPELAKKGGAKKPVKIADRSAIEKEIAAAEKQSVQIICMPDAAYPRLLRHIDDAPPVILARGHTTLFDKPALALVGTRNASLNARKFTEKLVADLTDAGFVIVSGLARGIDGCAHTAALSAGTIGVLGGGVDVVYPEENTALYNQMTERALVISEAPMGYAPQTHDFPRRNRIISGLSLGVVVVEAAMKSGSLITARMALEQGREVFAVPGSPVDPRAQGANNLIREGATLVENASDVLRVLKPQWPELAEDETVSGFATPAAAPMEEELERVRNEIIDLLSPTPTGIDDLIRTSGYGTGLVLTVLLELEIAGRLARNAGGKVTLIA